MEICLHKIKYKIESNLTFYSLYFKPFIIFPYRNTLRKIIKIIIYLFKYVQ